MLRVGVVLVVLVAVLVVVLVIVLVLSVFAVMVLTGVLLSYFVLNMFLLFLPLPPLLLPLPLTGEKAWLLVTLAGDIGWALLLLLLLSSGMHTMLRVLVALGASGVNVFVAVLPLILVLLVLLEWPALTLVFGTGLLLLLPLPSYTGTLEALNVGWKATHWPRLSKLFCKFTIGYLRLYTTLMHSSDSSVLQPSCASCLRHRQSLMMCPKSGNKRTALSTRSGLGSVSIMHRLPIRTLFTTSATLA